MRVLWIGEYTTPQLMERLISYGYRPMSITVAQKNLIEGIAKKHPIDTIGGCRLPFKYGGKTAFKGEEWTEADGSFHSFVDLITLPYIELLYKTKKLKTAVRKWAKEYADEKCCVIIYGLHSPYLKCAHVLKKYVKDLMITCIVPDLPEYYDFHPSRLKKVLKKFDQKIIDREMKNCNKFILFADTMNEKLNIPKDKYIVMEGCVNCESESRGFGGKKDSTKTVLLYSGSLNYGYGIDKLLAAFEKIKSPNFELKLIGSGSMVNKIKAAAEKDARINYVGYVSDREILREYQRKADILLCMIPPENVATKYCFPSKLFEYMISGNPTVAFRLKGVGEEYYNYITTFVDDTPEGIANTIIRLASLGDDECAAIGKKAKEFIVNNKNHYIQGRKVLDYATKE